MGWIIAVEMRVMDRCDKNCGGDCSIFFFNRGRLVYIRVHGDFNRASHEKSLGLDETKEKKYE